MDNFWERRLGRCRSPEEEEGEEEKACRVGFDVGDLGETDEEQTLSP